MAEVAEILCVLPINFRATERRNRDWSLLEVSGFFLRSHDTLGVPRHGVPRRSVSRQGDPQRLICVDADPAIVAAAINKARLLIVTPRCLQLSMFYFSQLKPDVSDVA